MVWRIAAVTTFDFGSLGVELGSHQAQSFGACEIEAGAGDPKTVFSLATQELGCQHQGWVALGEVEG